MHSEPNQINHVSDTALWVAYYRAKETERPDALFKDSLAQVLIGERGKQIADSMKATGRYTEWAVIARTVMIDNFIAKLIGEGVDTIVNLGAGLDTRPYRMKLPAHLKWIEADYPQIIDLKNERLKSEKPVCQLVRVSIDLADVAERKKFLTQINAESKKILVLTEGVIPYLSPEQVASLGAALHEQSNIAYWITEYFDARVYKYLKTGLRSKRMKNAPFLFFPPDWIGFFTQQGWAPLEIQYSSGVAETSGRQMPMPWFAFLFKLFASRQALEKSKKIAGYMILKKIKV